MYNIFIFKVFQSVKQLNSEPSNQSQRQAFEIIHFEEFVQVDRHKLEWDAQMRSEHGIVLHVDDIHCVVHVVLFEEL